MLNHRLVALTATLLLATSLIVAQSASPSGTADSPPEANGVLKLADRIMDEAQRQHAVNQRMDAVIGGLVFMIDDLDSNGLLPEGNGVELKKIAVVLATLGEKHVPSAARHLEAARAKLDSVAKNIKDVQPNLTGAHGEIKTILSELDKLLTKATQFQASEDLLTKLRQIIARQDALKKETILWGQAMEKKESGAAGKSFELESRQRDLSKDVVAFHKLLVETKDATTDALELDRLKKADAAMVEMKIDQAMVAAATSIKGKSSMMSIQKQDRSLADLREIEKLLSDADRKELQDLKELKKELEDILKEQQEARKNTEKAPEKMKEEKKELWAKQHDVLKKTEKVEEKKEEVPPEAKTKIEKAKEEMKKAEQNIEKDEKKPAVEKQKEAEKHLSSAIDEVDKKIKEKEEELAPKDEQPPPEEQEKKEIEELDNLTKEQEEIKDKTENAEPEDLPKLEDPQKDVNKKLDNQKDDPQQPQPELKKAKEETKAAAEELKKGDKKKALDHQEKALQAMKDLKKKKEQQLADLQKLPPDKKEKPEDKERLFTKTNPLKSGDNKGDLLKDSLADKERAQQVLQNYGDSLPPEYRKLLEDYYEGLSK